MKLFTKPFICISIIAFFFTTAHAQVKVGDNVQRIHPSAVFEVESKTKGVLIPRLTAGERKAIAAPDTGLIVYQTDDKSGFYFYDGNKWSTIKGGNTVLPDADGDGITDQFDQEPNTPAGAPVDSHGIVRDTDGDGVPDYKDKELLTSQNCFPVDADGIGYCRVDHFSVSLPDADGDGVADQFDAEPNTPVGATVDTRGVTRDTDGDGIPDYKDKEVLTLQACFPVNADGYGKCHTDTKEESLWNLKTGRETNKAAGTDYAKMIAALTEAMKAQDKKIEELEKKIEILAGKK